MTEKYIIDKVDIQDLLTGKDIPLANGKARAFCIEINGGITNGEVIQALFPNVKKHESTEYHNIIFVPSCHLECCNEEWWNAPYGSGKAESEE